MIARAGLVVAVALLGGCGGRARLTTAVTPRAGETPVTAAWQHVATRADAARLSGWRDAFVGGLAAARSQGHGADVAREGTLLMPDIALAQPGLPPGDYRCRVVKLGATQPAMPSFSAYPAFACRVANEGDVASFRKLTGSQRPLGLLFRDTPTRDVFLGTLSLGDETTSLEYGRDTDRDLIGAVERIGPRRWRMLLPRPRFESMIDVVELVPVS